jgi:hypothetical protein
MHRLSNVYLVCSGKSNDDTNPHIIFLQFLILRALKQRASPKRCFWTSIALESGANGRTMLQRSRRCFQSRHLLWKSECWALAAR